MQPLLQIRAALLKTPVASTGGVPGATLRIFCHSGHQRGYIVTNRLNGVMGFRVAAAPQPAGPGEPKQGWTRITP